MKKISSATVSDATGTSEKKSWFSWTNDGPDPNTNSLSVILNWLTTPGNYSRYMGGAGGETKLAVAGEILVKIREAGIKVNRNNDSIIKKITELVKSYKDAHHIKNQTGQSMENVHAACKYFDVLDPILGCRPSIQPIMTNKTIAVGNTNDEDSDDSYAESVATVPVLQHENRVATKTKNDKTISGHKVSFPFNLCILSDQSCNNTHLFLIFPQNKKKKSLISKETSNRNAKQEEREIFQKYLSNQSAAIKLKSRKLKREMKAEKKAASEKQREIIFDVMKKRLELEKMGASKEYLDKYFRITPLAKKDDSSSGEQSETSSD
jgi:hypothetical protein